MLQEASSWRKPRLNSGRLYATTAGTAVATTPDGTTLAPPRQGFFEHPEYLAVRAHLPAPWQDILDLAYYSGWRKNGASAINCCYQALISF